MKIKHKPHIPKPKWLKKSLPKGANYQRIRELISQSDLHTVCQEASCPNMFECFSKDTATFMILGSLCTRNCQFCNITHNIPLAIDPNEPERIAKAVQDLNLQYVVITSVTRDDLTDGGASHFAETITAVKSLIPPPQVEVLIPDFNGNIDALRHVISAKPEVLNHNIETIEHLYSKVRPEADFKQSLALLKNAKQIDANIITKSGLMVGFGESLELLEKTFGQLLNHGCDILTIGQYLQPTRAHLEVEKYYSPEEFLEIETIARKIGFTKVAAGPFVRSSYQAKDLFES